MAVLLADEIVAGLKGKKFLFIGLEQAEFNRIAEEISALGSVAKLMQPGDELPGSPEAELYDVVLLACGAEAGKSSWFQPKNLAKNTRPLILSGAREYLCAQRPAIGEFAQDVLIDPWHVEEALMRAWNIMREKRAAPASAEAGSEMRSQYQVVVADDNQITTRALSAILRAHDIEAHVEADGRAALDAIRRLLPDLVLLDLYMPGLNGFEVLTALKQDPATKAIPVVLLTSSDKTADIQRGSALCADGYLIKPFGAHDVLARVKKLLNRRLPGAKSETASVPTRV